MKIIVCLDERNGMSFCGKRQSMDRCLREHLTYVVGNETLWMNGYSFGQFADSPLKIQMDEDFLEKADRGDFCFVENKDLTPYMDKIRQLIVYRWDRVYPGDLYFPMEEGKSRLKLLHTESIKGYSHEQILQEVYQR